MNEPCCAGDDVSELPDTGDQDVDLVDEERDWRRAAGARRGRLSDLHTAPFGRWSGFSAGN